MTDAALREPWEEIGRQREAATLGIWVFLASEVLFFGGLFAGYAVARLLNGSEFIDAMRHTDIWYGTVNTAVLLTSSLTMAVAAQTAGAGYRSMARRCFVATAALGLLFLVLKGFEYHKDIVDGLAPGAQFMLRPAAAQVFFSFYWVMTGLHAVHLVIGIVLVSRLAVLSARTAFPLQSSPQIEVTALYWHLVDVIWIILYPLLYLGGRA